LLQGLGKRRLKSRIGAWAGLAAFSMHLFLAVAQFVPTKAAADVPSGMPSFLVICMAYGTAGDANTDDHQGGEHPSCPVCTAEVLAGGLLPVVTVELATTSLPGRVELVQLYEAPASGKVTSYSNPRAPPFFV